MSKNMNNLLDILNDNHQIQEKIKDLDLLYGYDDNFNTDIDKFYTKMDNKKLIKAFNLKY